MTLEAEATPKPAVLGSPLHLPDFRWLWLGGVMVSLGVQFYAVGLVWLVLYLTGSGVQLGGLLTVAAVPRAVSMLLSGALIDRYPPRRILLLSALLNGGLMAAALVLLGAGWMSMAALFIIAPLSGLVDATFYPTNSALVPRLVEKAQLGSANALIQTADTLANIAGPALSGILIGEVGRLAGSPLTGLLAGFAVNTLLFAGGALVFLRLSRKTDLAAVQASGEAEPLGRSVVSGVRYVLAQPAIRVSLLMVSVLNFAAIGPIVVGGALLIERRFGGDATMYGIFSGGFGVGMLIGGALVSMMGMMRRPGMALVYTSAALAVGLVVLGFAPSFEVAFGVSLFIGIFGAFTNINAVTLMQMKTEAHMQGRVASLLVFAAVALDPFSNAASGVVGELNLTLLFVGAGVLVAVGAIVAWFNRTLREEVVG